MFRPNTSCDHLRRLGRDLHAREVFADAVTIPIAIISLENRIQVTTVRADSSASRGSAEEGIAQARILVSPKLAISVDDRVVIDAITYRVIATHVRRTVFGVKDHIEVTLGVVP